MYDFAIIGAGVNGCFMAYRLKAEGKKVVLIDPRGIGGSGSQAAGAFLSPKVGKGGTLKEITNKAYKTAINFYETFPTDIFTQNGLLHFPKNIEDADKNFDLFKQHSDNSFTKPLSRDTNMLHEKDLAQEGLFFKDGGVVDPLLLCQNISKNIDCLQEQVKVANYTNDYWDLGICQAKGVILANGAYDTPFNTEYIGLRAVWGERIEVLSSTQTPINYHQHISVSATKPNGRIVIGATHVQHLMHKELDASHVDMLLDKASQLLDLKDIEVLDHRGGVRSGSFDYLPMIGKLLNTNECLAKFPKLTKGTKVNQENLCYYPDVYIINGSGGRGFVLAPFLSQQLTQFIINEAAIDERLTTNRLFNRWVKKRAKGPNNESH